MPPKTVETIDANVTSSSSLFTGDGRKFFCVPFLLVFSSCLCSSSHQQSVRLH